ncbi:MAG: 16S rRNA (adenine(1518)-N(6)/adenine(1519)-N(6))-dimethyltransferase RsmA [Alphaproteobacteria bacterium]
MHDKHSILRCRQHLRKFGQNFLIDDTLICRIVKASSPTKNDVFIEIGPGTGNLTKELLKHDIKKLYAIEKDEKCLPFLANLQKKYKGIFSLINGDARKIYLQSLIKEDHNIKVIANLPYNIGTFLFTKWLYDTKRITSFTLMFQKEVAQRIIAKSFSKHYGRLSVLSSYVCNTNHLFDVPSDAFVPKPKVTSSVIQCLPKALKQSEIELIPFIEKITKFAFAHRRKMIKFNLKGLFKNTELALDKAQILQTERAENISCEKYIILAKFLKEHNQF